MEAKKTTPQLCAELISHNPPTLDPAVSSHSPLCHVFFSLHFSQLHPSFNIRRCPQFLSAHTDLCTVLGIDHV